MKYLKLTKYLAMIAVGSLIFTACKKTKVSTPMGDAGQTLVKILGGGTPAGLIKNPVDFVATPTRILAAQVRRDIPNETELMRTMKVTVKDDTTAVKAANAAYKLLPPSWFTVQTTGVKSGGVAGTMQGGTWTFTFAPGSFAQEIYITIPDATLLDPSSLYGVGFTVTSADANGVISSEKTLIIEIGAKNDWDGRYAVTGPMVDVTNATLIQWNNPAIAGFPAANGGAWELHLITAGASTVLMFDNTIWGAPFHPILSGTANSGWGSFCPYVNINPATGTIADIWNYYGEIAQGGSGPPLYSAGNTRRCVLDPSGVNAVQGNKDILIKYFMAMPSVIAAPPHYRVFFDEKWKYIGPR